MLEVEADRGDSREERAFRLWINSVALGDAELHVQNLFTDCKDGLVLAA